MKKMKLDIQKFSVPYTYIDFEDLPSTNTPLDSTNMNQMQNLIHNEITSLNPVGIISTYAGSTAPTGWLICDGSAVSRTTYADLFSAIGTTYGTGDGSTTFNLPNLKGKVPVGYNSSDSSFDTLGETGGEKTHTLTTSEMPSHNHDGIYWGNPPSYPISLNPGSSAGYKPNWEGSSPGNSGIRTAYTGGDQAHNNLQPYIVLNYIIKY